MTEAIYAAFAKAQGEFDPIHRDRTVKVKMRAGGEYTFSYAPLESILKATLPALSKNGLSITQKTLTPPSGSECVETTLYHADGGSISNQMPIFVKADETGPQAYGSALTYARRYGVTLLLGVCADDDDDGNAAEGNSATVTREAKSAQATKPTEAEELALRFRRALAVGIDTPLWEIHEEVVKDDVLYKAAWKLLTASQRADIKNAIDRVKDEMAAQA
jgi:ERF superfamily protein